MKNLTKFGLALSISLSAVVFLSSEALSREPDVVLPQEEMISTCPDNVGYSVWVIGASQEEIEKVIPSFNTQFVACTHTIIHRHGVSPTGERKETDEGTLVVLGRTDDLATAEAIAEALREAGNRAYILYFNNWER